MKKNTGLKGSKAQKMCRSLEIEIINQLMDRKLISRTGAIEAKFLVLNIAGLDIAVRVTDIGFEEVSIKYIVGYKPNLKNEYKTLKSMENKKGFHSDTSSDVLKKEIKYLKEDILRVEAGKEISNTFRCAFTNFMYLERKDGFYIQKKCSDIQIPKGFKKIIKDFPNYSPRYDFKPEGKLHL